MNYTDLNNEEILSRLVVRLYQTPIHGKNSPDELDYTYQIDYSETCSVLALEFDDHFEIMHRSKLKERNLPEEVAFLQAKQNILQVPAELCALDFEREFTGFEMWQVEAGFFAAAQLIDLSKNFPMLAGKQGALVVIPSSSLGMVVPINVFDHEAVCAIAVRLFDLSYEIYSEANHSITYNVYWWKDGKFYRVPIEPTTGPLICQLPQYLQPVWIEQIEEAEENIKQNRTNAEPATDSKFKSHAEFLSIHPNMHTGHVVVFRRNLYGKVLDIQDTFEGETLKI